MSASRNFVNVLLLVIIACVGSRVATAQCTPEWLYGPDQGTPGVNNPVRAMTTWDPDGAGPEPEVLVAGGTFTVAGDVAANHVAYWDGASWHALGAGVGGADGYVRALTVYNGELVAGGIFATAGSSAPFVARWDGADWQTFGEGIAGPNNAIVYALTVYDGDLIAGGYFTSAGGVTADYIARWDGTSWGPLGTGMNSDVRALTVYEGDLIAGGTFWTAGGVNALGIARWDGAAWEPLDAAIVDTFQAYALMVGDGKLVVGGQFTKAGDATANGIAAWDGASWHALGTGVGGDQPIVFALVQWHGDLFAGGQFDTAGGVSAARLARWDGANWHPLDVGRSVPVEALAVYGDEVIVSGQLRPLSAPRQPLLTPVTKNVAAWNGTIWRALGTGMNNVVYATTVYDRELIAGGAFWSAGAVSAHNIARWNGVGWQTLGTGVDDYVCSLAVYGGELVAGGFFRTAGGVPAYYIGRWDGANWGPVGTGLPGPTYALAVYDNKLVVGGYFAPEYRQATDYITQWDGATWSALGTGTDGPVYALAIYDGDLYAGGEFNTAGGKTAHNIARWDGTKWYILKMSSMDPGTDGPVYALAAYDGDLVVAGKFTQAANQVVNRIAAWDGTAWRALGDGIDDASTYTEVESLVVYDGRLIVGGEFASAGAVSVDGIAQWDGTVWHSVGVGGVGGHALAVYHGELITAGGAETSGGHYSSYWARWGCPPLAADMNCDGVVSMQDIEPFVLALFDRDGYGIAYPACNPLNGDFTGDGVVNNQDIDGFVAAVLSR